MFAHVQFSVTVYQAGNLSLLGRVSVDLMINTIEGRCLLHMLLPFFSFHLQVVSDIVWLKGGYCYCNFGNVGCYRIHK